MKTLTAFMDLSLTAASFDAAIFIVRAMKERDDRGCYGLHIVLVPDEKGYGGIARKWGEHDEAATMWRLWHIVIAMCPLAGASVTLAASRWQAQKLIPSETDQVWWPEGKAHFMRPLIEAARRGEKIPKLRATDAARRYVADWHGEHKKFVTFTLRNQTTSPERNSNEAEWGELDDIIFEAGYGIVWIRDAHQTIGEGIGNFAAIDVDLRLALYERAAMNLIGNNGPAALLQLSDAPYLAFGFGIPADAWTKHMAEHFAMQPGDQFPWANKNQRVVWKPDTFEVMKAEFESWEQRSRV